MSLQAERHCIWILSCRRRSKLLGKRWRRKKGERMKVLLLFPPSWHPSQPYLSLPSLTAFLRQNGISEVRQRDLNIELLDILLTKKECSEFYQGIINKLKSSGRTSVHSSRYQEKYQTMVDAVESIPALMTSLSNDMRYSVYSSQDIFKALDDEEENIFLNLYKKHILSSILESSPNLVGISITNTSQIIPGLTLARLIKNQHKESHITIGGSVFTKLIENIKKVDGLFSIVDSFIVFEGEHALLELVGQLDGKRDCKKVPNLIYRENGVTKINEPFYTEDLNKLPTPDFDGFPLKLYHTPASVLPVQTSRGCYYSKCSFCNLHLDHRSFRLRRTELLMEDIWTLSQKYNTPYFFFADESVPINKLREISQSLLEKQWDIKWMGGVRFENALDGDLLEKMHASGCQKLVFGLESYNQI